MLGFENPSLPVDDDAPPLDDCACRNVPGPGQYAWAEKDRPKQPGGKFGHAAQVNGAVCG